VRRFVLLGLVGLCLLPSAAGASGVTTHAFMADKGRATVRTGELRELLGAHRDALLSGAAYPDGGYAVSAYPGGDYGEVTHWEKFVDAYAEVLRADPACAPLLEADGPCAADVAHLMGTAAHGIGDEMWDWMFEPQAADNGETPTHPFFASGLPGAAELGATPVGGFANSIEYAMDLIAIVDHLRASALPAYLPSTDRLLAAYAKIGRDDVTRDGILAGHTVIHGAMAAERAAVAADYLRVKQTMPKTAARMYDDSGGVVDVARAAAHYYEALWQKLGGKVPALRVSAIHPERGEQGVPWEWLGRSVSPGPRDGFAENRIIAVMNNAVDLPFSSESIRIEDTVTGEEVPQREGYPRPGPYHATDGTHSVMAVPALNLVPCRWYRVVVTPALRDLAGSTLTKPYRWRFQTRSAGTPAPAGCRAVAEPPPHVVAARAARYSHHH
jgi:hypothetical protein